MAKAKERTHKDIGVQLLPNALARTFLPFNKRKPHVIQLRDAFDSVSYDTRYVQYAHTHKGGTEQGRGPRFRKGIVIITI
jgi:hypothetical protein